MWLTLLAKFWFVIPIALLMASTAYYKHDAKSEHTERVKVAAEYEQFTVGVKLAGDKATLEAKRKDAENAKTIQSAVAGRADALKRLRDSVQGNSSGRPLSLTPAVAAGTSEICFEPTAFAAAVEQYRRSVRRIVEQGDEAQIDAQALIQGWPK